MENFGTILRDSILVFSGRRDALVKALTLSGLLEAVVILHYFAIAGALGLPVPLSAFFLIIPLSVFVMMLPISINAIGIRENVFVFFFGFYGVSKADAVAFAWLAP